MQLNGSTYQYDANGNMTHDGRRGLDLSWNHLNLPSSICSDEDEDALVNYTYLADGTKVITQQPATGEGYAYLGSATYKRVNNVWTLESVPFTGGRFIANATGGMDEYRYITDHLGSTRVIVTGTDYHEVEHNDYYPFGKRISDNTLPTTQNNRWRFSGKEIQTLGGVGLVDFGARLYDDFSGRWKTQDALTERYFDQSPYSYCGNNPVNVIDPDGRDPIYAKNFWGKVKLIGDDGNKSTGSYLVRSSVAREVRRATKAGSFYTGDLSESKKVMHIPTGQKFEGVKQSYEDTKITQKENGGHANIGDSNVTRWDEGSAAISFTDEDGNQGAKASLQMFVVNGDNTMPVDASNVEMWWHTHPNTTVNGISLGNSTPSDADYGGQNTLTNRGYKGNTFVIGVRSATVTFFNKDGILTTVKWTDFLRMGGQKE